jgi:hypothetical protein
VPWSSINQFWHIGGLWAICQSNLLHAEIIVWNVIYPELAGAAVSVPISIILPGVIVGGAVGGMLGTFLSAPLLGIAQEIAGYTLKKIRGGDPYPDETGLGEGQPKEAGVSAQDHDCTLASCHPERSEGSIVQWLVFGSTYKSRRHYETV